MGHFITFEGGEGSGKSTQWNLLAQALKTKGMPTVATREPGGTPAGRAIRQLLLTPEGHALEALPELLLYGADRAHHLTQVIRPALAAGRWVICDRYQDSTTVYQGLVRGLDSKMIQTLANWTTGGLKPRLTFLLDLPPELGLARSKSRLESEASSEDRFESETLEFHQQVRAGFLELAEAEPERFAVLDANQDVEELHQTILTKVLALS